MPTSADRLPPEAVAAFHTARPGITEDLLVPALDRDGRNPYQWLCEALPAGASVLDLACGTAPVSDHVHGYRGVDRSPVEIAEAGRRRPGVVVRVGDALEDPGELRVGAVTVAMALMLLDLPGVLRLAARVLEPGGVLTAMVPLRGDAVRGTRYGQVLAALGELDRAYPTDLSELPPSPLTLVADHRRDFLRPPDRALVLSSFYAPRATTADRATALDLLGDPLPYPLRRLVWRQPADLAEPGNEAPQARH